MSGASYTTRGGVAVITVESPPVNGLGHRVRTELVAAIDRANAEPGVRALVLVGAGKIFSGGADLKEFNTPLALAEPTLHTVIRAAEESPKPVVVALNGLAMGG